MFAHRNKSFYSRGWTLLELLMVVTIAGTLLTIAATSYASARQKSLIAQAKVDLSLILQSIERHKLSNLNLPDSLAEIGFDDYRDPWGNPYAYLNFSEVKGKGSMRKDRNLVPINSKFDLYSMGPDGASKPPLSANESRDDVIVANDGGFIGLASDY